MVIRTWELRLWAVLSRAYLIIRLPKKSGDGWRLFPFSLLLELNLSNRQKGVTRKEQESLRGLVFDPLDEHVLSTSKVWQEVIYTYSRLLEITLWYLLVFADKGRVLILYAH